MHTINLIAGTYNDWDYEVFLEDNKFAIWHRGNIRHIDAEYGEAWDVIFYHIAEIVEHYCEEIGRSLPENRMNAEERMRDCGW